MALPLSDLVKIDVPFTSPAFATALEKKQITRVRIRTTCYCRLYFKAGQYREYFPTPGIPAIEIEFKNSAAPIAFVEALDDQVEDVGYTPLCQIDDRIVNFF